MKNQLTKIFTCSHCGAQSPKWQGRCLDCGKWGTIIEEVFKTDEAKKISVTPDKILNLNDLPQTKEERISSGIEEIDRVLGGGIVEGSLILLGGDPGIGKSTLALQISKKIKDTLYISGEESAKQVKIRAERLNLDFSHFQFLPQTNIEKIIVTAKEHQPKLIIIDSIQTITSEEINGAAGSISQITHCTGQLMSLAKNNNIAVIVIGHVTKDGMVAGPKTLEHLVDVVLYLENDNQNFYKILRGNKNRFGSTGEIGIFEMTQQGLCEVVNPSQIFIDHNSNQISGNITAIVIEGSRPFLVEIQALAVKTVFGYPQRKCTGFDQNRLQMLLAVIFKHTKINFSNHDIYLNVVGGLKIKETAADLAVCLALISAYLDKPIKEKTAAFGEVGLSGEIRNVSQADKRLNEAKKLKFNSIIIPDINQKKSENITLIKNISEIIAIFKNNEENNSTAKFL